MYDIINNINDEILDNYRERILRTRRDATLLVYYIAMYGIWSINGRLTCWYRVSLASES